jgi:RNA polymerase sigma factor (sigma-70 family)
MVNEIQLWDEFQRGDVEAYTELYNIFTSQLYCYGMKFTNDSTLVEDSIHDLFCTLWTSRERLSQPLSVRNYLYKSLRTSIFKKLTRNSLFLVEEAVLDFHFELSVDEKLTYNEQILHIQKKVEQALKKLTSRQREIIYYRFYQNLGFDEIADIMDMQVRATYKLTARALEVLRHSISAAKLLSFLLLLQAY